MGSGFRSIDGQFALKYGVLSVDKATAPSPQSFMSAPFYLAINPDGKKLAVGYKGGLDMYSLPKMKRIGRTVTTTTIDHIEFSPDCQKIAVHDDSPLGHRKVLFSSSTLSRDISTSAFLSERSAQSPQSPGCQMAPRSLTN